MRLSVHKSSYLNDKNTSKHNKPYQFSHSPFKCTQTKHDIKTKREIFGGSPQNYKGLDKGLVAAHTVQNDALFKSNSTLKMPKI